MKNYSIAINSIVLIFSFVIGVGAVYAVLKPIDASAPTLQARHMNSIGVIQEIQGDSYVFEYSFQGKKWEIAIRVTEETNFQTAPPLVENGVAYGRDFKQIKRADVTAGTHVVADWVAIDGQGYIATDITVMNDYAAVTFTK